MCLYTAVLFLVFLVIYKKNCKCLDLVNEGKNLWSISELEQYSTLMRNRLFTKAYRTRMDSKCLLVRERRQTWRATEYETAFK